MQYKNKYPTQAYSPNSFTAMAVTEVPANSITSYVIGSERVQSYYETHTIKEFFTEVP